jgi:hypothetical protein
MTTTCEGFELAGSIEICCALMEVANNKNSNAVKMRRCEVIFIYCLNFNCLNFDLSDLNDFYDCLGFDLSDCLLACDILGRYPFQA